MDLFEFRDLYPNAPGFKRRATSKAAADAMKPKAPTLRDRCFSQLTLGPKTADQVATAIAKERGIPEKKLEAFVASFVLTIRPRISELCKLGLIYDTGRTAENASKKQAVVWDICGAKR